MRDSLYMTHVTSYVHLEIPLEMIFVSTVQTHISSCELNLGDQYMYVYEDSNFGFFRIPQVYVYAHKWLEHQILGKSLPVSNFTVCY